MSGDRGQHDRAMPEQRRSQASSDRPGSNEPVIDGLQKLVNEEMHLLGQELEDSLNVGDSHRLAHITRVLNEAEALLATHREARPSA